jgi:hypothetical protein
MVELSLAMRKGDPAIAFAAALITGGRSGHEERSSCDESKTEKPRAREHEKKTRFSRALGFSSSRFL